MSENKQRAVPSTYIYKTNLPQPLCTPPERLRIWSNDRVTRRERNPRSENAKWPKSRYRPFCHVWIVDLLRTCSTDRLCSIDQWLAHDDAPDDTMDIFFDLVRQSCLQIICVNKDRLRLEQLNYIIRFAFLWTQNWLIPCTVDPVKWAIWYTTDMGRILRSRNC